LRGRADGHIVAASGGTLDLAPGCPVKEDAVPREPMPCQECAELFTGTGLFCSKRCFLRNQARLKKAKKAGRLVLGRRKPVRVGIVPEHVTEA
jgi:hypothetical protein